MVNFEALLDESKLEKIVDPKIIFQNLEKDQDKEFLRPSQDHVLKEWNEKCRNSKDIIVKLNTGHGKTLVGLLMLQASINEGKGPALYICPNNYLVDQTISQAKSFGIEAIKFEIDNNRIPLKFLNCEAILVTTCNKLFNGKSVFGVIGDRREKIEIGAIVVDDAHKCLEIIRDSFSIQFNSEQEAYRELFNLFSESLKRQGEGTHAEINTGHDESLLRVPFWTWYDKRGDVLEILSRHKNDSENHLNLFFAWNLIKNKLEYCTCIISGRRMEIVPRLLPIDLIPSFYNAKRRIFLSATLTEDSVLVRDMGIDPESILNPLIYTDEKYSGERLVIIPSLIDEELNREKIIKWISEVSKRYGSFGFFALVPSLRYVNNWPNSVKTDVKNLIDEISTLKNEISKNNAKSVRILVNEYDGIDLPGHICRVLCLDSLPTYSSLIDRYEQYARGDSRISRQKMSQIIEQGIGRSIRGPGDWSIILIIGDNLTNFLGEKAKRANFSQEVQMQIKIGETVTGKIKTAENPIAELEKLLEQCIMRDPDWKEFYTRQMSKVELNPTSEKNIHLFELEREAELAFQNREYSKAIDKCVSLVNENLENNSEMGWYLQLKATYQYPLDQSESMNIQLRAFKENNLLSCPEEGITYSKLAPSSTNQAQNVLRWIKDHENHNTLILDVKNRLDDASFMQSHEIFERGIYNLGTMLGFKTQRPDKEIKKGPDNLWQIGNDRYWVIECKNEVTANRSISRGEAEQMNTSIDWFKDTYEGVTYIPVMLHPADCLMDDAYCSGPLWVIQSDNLEKLKQSVYNFYMSLGRYSFDDLTAEIVAQELNAHSVDKGQLLTYTKRVTK